MIYSGLDWSGSPGNTHGPWLVVAIAHVDEVDFETLDTELATVRATLRLDPGFVFHHSETTVATRRAFFAALHRVPVSAHVHMLNKAAWGAEHVAAASGFYCICDGIITLLMRCPADMIEEQMLYIDLPRGEGKVVTRYRTTIRQAMRRAKRPTFRDMKPRPDDQADAVLIQVADMVAGEVREHSGLAGPYLPGLRSRIRVV
jgi:hypothetical protein